MPEIRYTDHLEKKVGETLEKIGVRFIHESQGNGSNLDFFLPDYDVYIEVKQFHADRVANQLSKKDNVILLQGKKAVDLFEAIVTKSL